MKAQLVFAATLVTTWLGIFVPHAFANHCSIGQRASVLWKGNWYPARVLDVNGDLCYISYEGYDSSWNEWVEPQRFRALFSPGQSVNILWRGQWYPGRILEVSGNSYKITYDGYDSSWNEWVEPERLSY